MERRSPVGIAPQRETRASAAWRLAGNRRPIRLLRVRRPVRVAARKLTGVRHGAEVPPRQMRHGHAEPRGELGRLQPSPFLGQRQDEVLDRFPARAPAEVFDLVPEVEREVVGERRRSGSGGGGSCRGGPGGTASDVGSGTTAGGWSASTVEDGSPGAPGLSEPRAGVAFLRRVRRAGDGGGISGVGGVSWVGGSPPESGASARNRAARFVSSVTPSPTWARAAPPPTRRAPNCASPPPADPSRPSAELQFRPTAPIRAPRFWARRPTNAATLAARMRRTVSPPIHFSRRSTHCAIRLTQSQIPTPEFPEPRPRPHHEPPDAVEAGRLPGLEHFADGFHLLRGGGLLVGEFRRLRFPQVQDGQDDGERVLDAPPKLLSLSTSATSNSCHCTGRRRPAPVTNREFGPELLSLMPSGRRSSCH